MYGVQGQQVGALHAPRLTGLAPILPRQGLHRDLLIANYSGIHPDLWVIDRGLTGPAQLTIFSSASGYASSVLRVKLPLRGLDPAVWAVGVGAGTHGGKPSLVLIRRDGVKHVQARVLSGDNGFKTVTLRQTLGLLAGPTTQFRYFVGSWNGKSAIYSIELRTTKPPLLRIATLRKG
jgi:hypothetical protein